MKNILWKYGVRVCVCVYISYLIFFVHMRMHYLRICSSLYGPLGDDKFACGLVDIGMT
jgi:hypothetical protein